MMTQAGPRPVLCLPPQPESAQVFGVLDVAGVQQSAAVLCRQIGFAPGTTFDVMLAVSEVGQHLVRRDPGALLSLHGVKEDVRACVILIIELSRPPGGPLDDFSSILKDMDEVSVLPENPTRIVAVKWGTV